MRFARNKVIFQNDVVSCFKDVALIKSFSRDWALAKTVDHIIDKSISIGAPKPSSRSSSVPKNVWLVKPSQDHYKINFDGSKLRDGSVSYSFNIRDWKSAIVVMGALALHNNNSILLAEAWGMREDVHAANL